LGNTSLNDDVAFIVAHELAAVFVVDKGYFLGYTSECSGIGRYLSDMFSTPLRDSMLAEYGFDVANEFSLRTRSAFAIPCSEVDDYYDIVQLANACVYVQLVLYWQDVLGNHGIPSDIEHRYMQCFPNSWRRGESIIATIDEVGGYDTPAKAKTIFQRIIDEYELEYCMCVG